MNQRLPKHLQALLFDFDGTLLDSFSAHYKAYAATFAHFGIEITPDELIRNYSPDWFQVYRAFGIPETQWAQADSIWLAAAAREEPLLFPGAHTGLQQLHTRYQLGLVTAGSKDRVLRDLNKTNIAEFFQVIITGDDVTQTKPAPEGLLQALNHLQVDAKSALYVGDTAVDHAAAQAAGLFYVGIAGPFHDAAEPYLEVQNLAELMSLLGHS